jgi:hypothetical protein
VMTGQNREPAGLLRFLARSGLTLALGFSSAKAATIDFHAMTATGAGTYNAQGLDHYYSPTSSGRPLGLTASVLDADPIAGPFRIAEPNSEWLGSGSSQGFAGLTGTLDSTARLVATLSADGFRHEYDRALADRGEYDSLLTVKNDEPSPVPLPPAILLLGSVLAGLVLISRRQATEFLSWW